MRKGFFLLILYLLSTPLAAFGEVKAKAYYFFLPATNQIIQAKNQDLPLPPASTTKIATALTSLELYPLDLEVEVRPEAVLVSGTKIYLKPGEKITVKDLIYGLMLESGNDAANALAWVVGKGNFMLILNYYLRQMGLVTANFKNPSGLSSPGHEISAKDLSLLTYYALTKKEFANICKTEQYETKSGIKKRIFHNTNRLLRKDHRVIGVKTGTTSEAGKCLVGAWQGKYFIIGTVLNCPDRFNAMYQTFLTSDEKFTEKILLKKGQKIYFKENAWWVLTKDVKILSWKGNQEKIQMIVMEGNAGRRALFYVNGQFLQEQFLQKEKPWR
ncbi:D-alanyl-D-alanine carboxypeptidase family protein [Carboxydothermus pertinax]|uniref:Peptidase S11 D-alanyl-D-alanine carboxypeptidase A N-terminal domain-containing protein n=1 Tax=Carboxydothermus pertinax TaxID=870242 RepID=A0A1L8CW45_9THEO|nr:serine hydrolase [Carboxydothermus pertinax]GAV23094.1 hypothetical protein cpu_16040 [Carboxydothermus pertinax]